MSNTIPMELMAYTPDEIARAIEAMALHIEGRAEAHTPYPQGRDGARRFLNALIDGAGWAAEVSMGIDLADGAASDD